MPMFVKKHHGALSHLSIQFGENEINSILRGHWGKKVGKNTGLSPKVSFTK